MITFGHFLLLGTDFHQYLLKYEFFNVLLATLPKNSLLRGPLDKFIQILQAINFIILNHDRNP